jgi:BASS family bile acid:Na+ symporter
LDANLLVKFLTLAGLIAIMLAMGLKVTLPEVIASCRNPRLVGLGLAANFVLVPAVTMGLLYLFEANAMVSVGFLILAVCPGAPVGPPFAAIAKGDVPSATGLMVVLAGLSAILSPALITLLAGRLLPQGELNIDYLAIVGTLLVSQILPLAAGIAIHQRAPKLAVRIVRPVGILANVLLLVVIALILAREYETLLAIRPRGWFGMLLLLAASLGIGWLCGGPGRATRKTLSLTTALRNVAVALVIVSNNFAETPAVTAVVAYGLMSILATLGCAFLFAALPEHSEVVNHSYFALKGLKHISPGQRPGDGGGSNHKP